MLCFIYIDCHSVEVGVVRGVERGKFSGTGALPSSVASRIVGSALFVVDMMNAPIGPVWQNELR